MPINNEAVSISRYTAVSPKKAIGAIYTPNILSNFVALQIIKTFTDFPVNRPLRILDPAIGD